MINFQLDFTTSDMSFDISFDGASYIVSEEANTFILEDENGYEVVAVLVDEETVFDATPNDIRIGKVAVTDEGVTVGEKVIPSYNTLVGTRVVPDGGKLYIPNINVNVAYHDYTKLQTMVCKYNQSISKSVSTEKVSINDTVYNVQSIEPISAITKNYTDRLIDLGVNNDLGIPCIIRYFTYKEML
jgi:hypothetical protein